jgi:uncharacterized protein YjbK
VKLTHICNNRTKTLQRGAPKMSQQIEIEFKNLLTEEEFDKLLNVFSVDQSHFFQQTNYYLDTAHAELRQAKCALRIREKNGQFKLTLKQPVEHGLLETDQPISKEEFKAFNQNEGLPPGHVTEIIENLQIPLQSVNLLGSLTTKRAKIPYKNGELFFDESKYFQKRDFELEYEVDAYDDGENIFSNLLARYDIPVRNTPSKIMRFLTEKNNEVK